MKPSHIQTPRNLADCSFVVGHYSYRPEQRPSLLAMLTQGFIGFLLFVGLLAAMLGYFDVLVK